MKQTKRLAVLLSVLAVILALWVSAVVLEGDVAQEPSTAIAAAGDHSETGQGAYRAPRTGVARFSTTDIAAP